MVTNVWNERDLPVQRAIVQIWDDGTYYIEPAHIVERTRLSEAVVQQALHALSRERPPLIEWTDATSYDGPCIHEIRCPTGHARRVVGSWPTPESLAAKLIEALEVAADNEPDQDKRKHLKNVVLWLGSAGREVVLQVAAMALARGAGIG